MGVSPLAGPIISNYGDLCVDPPANTLWIVDRGARRYREYTLDGTPTGANFDNPALVLGGTPFGSGIAFHNGSGEFLVTYGAAAAGQVTDLSRFNHSGALFGPVLNVSGLGSAIRGIAFTPQGSTGSPSVYIYENSTGTILEIELAVASCNPPSALACGTNCATGAIDCQWQLGGSYSSITARVKNADTLAIVSSMTLPGSSTSTSFAGIPAGDYLVEVVGACPAGAEISAQPITHVANFVAVSNVIVRAAATTGAVDSAGTIGAVFDAEAKGYV